MREREVERSRLGRFEVDVGFLPVLNHQLAWRALRLDLHGGYEQRGELLGFLVLNESDVLRLYLDDPVEVPGAPGTGNDADHPRAGDEAEEVIAFHRPPFEVEPLGVAGVDSIQRGTSDIGE